jgi:oligopeptidase B
MSAARGWKILFSLASTTTKQRNTAFCLPTSRTPNPFWLPGVQYELSEGGDVFFILTNAGGAKDFKIMEAPVTSPGKENWREVVPHDPGTLILSLMAFTHYLVRLERRDGLPRIVVRDRLTGMEHAISFDEEAYSLGLGGSYEYDTDTIRLSYSSMTTPSQLFDYDMATRERTLLKTQEVPSGHDAANYVTRRIVTKAHDGEKVPVSLLYHKDTPLDGSAPCLLYGYGSYGIAIPASFNTNCLSLVDRGFIYAIAHIRGGKDRGYSWYDDGKMQKKTNTFKDFVSAAQHLIQEGFTTKGRIIAHGGSAGGMLMGAVVNMAPELFGGIVAEVPFVEHHARRYAAVDAARMAGMGKSDCIRSRLQEHRKLFALRQCVCPGLPTPSGSRRPY